MYKLNDCIYYVLYTILVTFSFVVKLSLVSNRIYDVTQYSLNFVWTVTSKSSYKFHFYTFMWIRVRMKQNEHKISKNDTYTFKMTTWVVCSRFHFEISKNNVWNILDMLYILNDCM